MGLLQARSAALMRYFSLRTYRMRVRRYRSWNASGTICERTDTTLLAGETSQQQRVETDGYRRKVHHSEQHKK